MKSAFISIETLAHGTVHHVTFRGAKGPVIWDLKRIKEQTESCQDPEVRAEWQAILDDAREALRPRRRSPETIALSAAMTEYTRSPCETTYEALVRATADVEGISDAEARYACRVYRT